ncbi:MAG: nitroreductase/quinone reductase family protein [Acidimicrobiales bacterium]
MTGRDEILRSILTERTVDIVTTGRRSGAARTTEIWITPLEGRVYVCGTPNASRKGVVHAPRDWLANLKAQPAFRLRLKTSVAAELTADAEVVSDPAERRRILSAPATEYYRKAVSLEAAVAHSPVVLVRFTGEAAWLNEAVGEAGR